MFTLILLEISCYPRIRQIGFCAVNWVRYYSDYVIYIIGIQAELLHHKLEYASELRAVRNVFVLCEVIIIVEDENEIVTV